MIIILGKIPSRGGIPPIDRILNRINIFLSLLETTEERELIERTENTQKNQTMDKIIRE